MADYRLTDEEIQDLLRTAHSENYDPATGTYKPKPPTVVRLSGPDLKLVAAQLEAAFYLRDEVRLFIDAEGLKLSINGGSFTPGIGGQA